MVLALLEETMNHQGNNLAVGRNVVVEIGEEQAGLIAQPIYEDAEQVFNAALTMTPSEIKQIDGAVLLAAVTIGYKRYTNASSEVSRLGMYDSLNTAMRKDAGQASIVMGDAWQRVQRLLGVQG